MGISWPGLNQIVCALYLRFFYGVTLGEADVPERIPYAREPRKLPVGRCHGAHGWCFECGIATEHDENQLAHQFHGCGLVAPSLQTMPMRRLKGLMTPQNTFIFCH
jgi:hypothetical protein